MAETVDLPVEMEPVRPISSILVVVGGGGGGRRGERSGVT